MFYPSEKEFIALSKKGNLIPVYKEILGDLDTPVSTYFKISQHSKYSFLLESVEGEEKVSRFSFVATDPETIIQSNGKIVQISSITNGKLKKHSVVKENPLSYVREVISKYKFVNIPGLPRFCGGLVGYLGYDMVRFFEKLPNKPKDDLKLPDMVLVLAKNLIIFDHINHKIKVVSCVSIPKNMSQKQRIASYRKSQEEINKLVAKIHKPLKMKDKKGKQKPSKTTVHSNFTEDGFKKIVRAAKKEIRKGEIIQVVLSQRFEVKLKNKPFDLYRVLRALNPSQDSRIFPRAPGAL
jgi:anthranilate synthase component 1